MSLMNRIRKLFGRHLLADPEELRNFTEVFRRALEEICGDYLNRGRWNDLPFAALGCRPSLPGEMILSFEMAQGYKGIPWYDAYVVFALGGACIILVRADPLRGVLSSDKCQWTVEDAKTQILLTVEHGKVEAIR